VLWSPTLGAWVAASSHKTAVSSDGVRWSESRKVADVFHVADSGSELIGVPGSGPGVLSSQDGLTWATHPGPATTDDAATALVADEAGLVLVACPSGEPPTTAVFRSTDGARTWRRGPSVPRLWSLWSGAPGLLVGAGVGGALVVSRDAGETFTTVDVGRSRDLRAVHGGGGLIVVVGEEGAALASTDGAATFRPLTLPELRGQARLEGVWVSRRARAPRGRRSTRPPPGREELKRGKLAP